MAERETHERHTSEKTGGQPSSGHDIGTTRDGEGRVTDTKVPDVGRMEKGTKPPEAKTPGEKKD